MTRIRGRPIHFELSAASREIFESIIISRFSVRDTGDEVLRTESGLSFVPRGQTNWKLKLGETQVLVASARPAIGCGDDSGLPITPDMVTVKASWHSPENVCRAHLVIDAGDNANLFYGLGAILVPEGFRIPIVTASQQNVRYYGLDLIENHRVFELFSDEFDLVLAKYHYRKNYIQDFLTETRGGGGYFVETHNFPHVHAPLSSDCGGYITIGKKHSADEFSFTAFRIPFGFALVTPANTIHGDGTISGEYAIAVATSSADADTVLFYNENTRAMPNEVFQA